MAGTKSEKEEGEQVGSTVDLVPSGGVVRFSDSSMCRPHGLVGVRGHGVVNDLAALVASGAKIAAHHGPGCPPGYLLGELAHRLNTTVLHVSPLALDGGPGVSRQFAEVLDGCPEALIVTSSVEVADVVVQAHVRNPLVWAVPVREFVSAVGDEGPLGSTVESMAQVSLDRALLVPGEEPRGADASNNEVFTERTAHFVASSTGAPASLVLAVQEEARLAIVGDPSLLGQSSGVCGIVPEAMWIQALTSSFLGTENAGLEDCDKFTKTMLVSLQELAEAADEVYASLGNEAPAVELSASLSLGCTISQGSSVADPEPAERHGGARFRSPSELSRSLRERVRGQNDVIDEVVRALAVPASGLGDPERPLLSLLFLGRTGVGKTLLAKSLADFMMADGERLPFIRLDMGEYAQEHEVSKILGAPPSYVGHDTSVSFVDRVRKDPRCVVLLDEVEKAHPKVWDSFLQVLDAGRMTDSSGHEVDMTQCVIVMTSNLGAEEAKRAAVGFGAGRDTTSAYMGDVRSHFRPEFVNRIDKTLVFNDITRDVALGIAGLRLGEVRERARRSGVDVRFSPSVASRVVEDAGFEEYGARDIARRVHDSVTSPLAVMRFEDQGTSRYSVSVRNGSVVVCPSRVKGGVKGRGLTVSRA